VEGMEELSRLGWETVIPLHGTPIGIVIPLNPHKFCSVNFNAKSNLVG
jgi:hypothetical protein